MLNPTKAEHLDRLARALDFSRWRLQPAREHRMKFLKEFVGSHYSYSGSDKPVPVNLLQLASNIYLRQLIPKAPRALVTSKNQQAKPIAADMTAWMEHAAQEMRLAFSFRVCVMNALHCLGVMKVGEARVGEMDYFGTSVAYGQPFAEPVDFDDLVYDVTAKRWDQCQFQGNRYRVPLEEAKENELFDKKERQKLTAQIRFAYNERGDPRVSTLSQSTMQLYDEYQDHVELWDIFLPAEQLLLTVPYSESVEGGFSGTKPLRVMKWEGPKRGPFIPLSYGDVPNNIQPAAPLQAMADLHDLANTLWRKLARQLVRQKTILGYPGTATDDAERINRANDGDCVRVDMIERVKELSTGGGQTAQANMIAVEQVKQLFTYMAGNLDTLGGLSPQAQTLGQDEMLNKNASAQVSEMQDRTIAFAQEVEESLFWHWWTNPVLTYSTSRQVAGQDIPVNITPQMRQIPYDQLGFKVDPFSAQHATPQSKLSAIMQIMAQTIMPALPVMTQQGFSVDWSAFLEIIANYGDMSELKDILKQGPPPEQQGAMEMAHSATQSPVTQRTQVRINRPGMTAQGHSQIMQQLAGSLGSQTNGAGRGVG